MARTKNPLRLPLIANWSATNYYRAFILNSVATAATASAAASFRVLLDRRIKAYDASRSATPKTELKKAAHHLVSPTPAGPLGGLIALADIVLERLVVAPLADYRKKVPHSHEVAEETVIFITSFFVSMVIFNLLYVLFHFGGGMSTSGRKVAYF